MIAVIETGSKQYLVKPNDKIQIEKVDGEKNSTINFDKVLLVSTEDGINVEYGTPYINNKVITATILDQVKGDKKIVFKMKPKKRYQKKIGHRQNYTIVQVNNF